MIDLLFGHGKINALQVIEIGKTVMAFSLGIPAHIANKIITTRFFAQGQPKYPLQASVLMVVLDIVLSVLLIRWLEHVGLALAMALAAWGSTLFLLFVIQQKHGWTVSKALRRFLWRIVLSCVISGALLCALQAILPAFRACSLPQQLGLLSGFLTLGTLLLFACFSYFRILSKRQWNILWKSFKKRGNNVEVL
jgi:putative peptidoglycan lipid II flippase